MAWQWYECTFRALRASRCLNTSEPFTLRHRPTFDKSSQYYNVGSLRRLQRRLISTSGFNSASEPILHENGTADTTTLTGLENRTLRAARIVPASPAYFSGQPNFIDSFLKLEHLCSKYATLPTLLGKDARRQKWVKHSILNSQFGERTPLSKYQQMIGFLKRLNVIDPSVMPDEVRAEISRFSTPEVIPKILTNPPTVDKFGRARAVGRRKTSNAWVYLVEGNGEVMVNGKSIVHVFPRIHDRESALWALRTSNRIDKYNVWAVAQGGGVTGQAEAIALAIARALLIHEPALKPMLRQAGVITVDRRQVERKKPGRPKARKRPAWVKR